MRFPKVSKEITELADTLAEHAHNVWARSRFDQGYLYGSRRCDDENSRTRLRHPLLLPWAFLPESAKMSNRTTTLEIVKVLQLIGYRCSLLFSAKTPLLLNRF